VVLLVVLAVVLPVEVAVLVVGEFNLNMEFSPDLPTLKKLFSEYSGIVGDVTPEQWLSYPKNMMYREGDSVALATYEYPGMYTLHWFFKVRGREALNLARKMLTIFFKESDAKAIRGLTRKDLKQACWAARQLGMTSWGDIQINDDRYELFTLTKDEFNG
jgi:hypothetical protein